MQPASDILEYYERHFRAGMVDLSVSCPVAEADPSFDVPNGYPEPGGLLSLRSAIAGLYPGLEADDVVVTNGATEALAACALVFSAAGTLIDVAPGSYPSFTSLARRLGGSFRSWTGSDDADVIVLANPTIPDGQLLDVPSLAERAHRAGQRLIADEVYLDLRPCSQARPAALCSATAISIGDLSKPLGLSGLRIGWAVSRDREAVCRIRHAVQELSGGPSTLAMHAAESAVQTYATRYAVQLLRARRNAPRVFGTLEAFGWTFTPPMQGWTFLASPPAALAEDALDALAAEGLFLVPASVFGRDSDGFRVSLFADPGRLRRALAIATCQERSGSLVILAKAPEVSKSRLAATIGAAQARPLAEAFLRDTILLAQASGRRLSMCFTPERAEPGFAALMPGADLVPQPDGDLGERIAAAIAGAANAGGPTVLIGTDTPHLPPAAIDEAFDRLAGHDLVLGPARDGGFYLLGIQAGRFPRRLFDGVEWSTGSVLACVLENARRLGLRVHQLAALSDVDDLESLRAMLAECGPGAAALTAATAQELGFAS